MDWNAIENHHSCQDKCLEVEDCVGWVIHLNVGCYLKNKLENKAEVLDEPIQVAYGPKQCPIDGGWTDWQYFTECKNQKRKGFRFCTNPDPDYGGKECQGDNVIVESCSEDAEDNEGLFMRYIIV